MNEYIQDGRLVVVGRNSTVWRALLHSSRFADITVCSIGHEQLGEFIFQPADHVWVFAYSRSNNENYALLESLAVYNFIDVNYISSASTNVARLTQCYSYPRVKLQAEEYAKQLCSARIVTIGWVYGALEELPAGQTAATSLNELADLMRSSRKSEKKDMNLFRMVDRPFSSEIERVLYRCYGALLSATGPFPCLLRPIDILLRSLNMRWYGYLYLSNRLWSTTI